MFSTTLPAPTVQSTRRVSGPISQPSAIDVVPCRMRARVDGDVPAERHGDVDERLARIEHGHPVHMISVLVETVTRLVVQQLLEAEQADYLGGRGRYERRAEGQVGSRNGYEPGRICTAEGPIEVAVPQVRGAGTPFRSSLMSFLDGNSEVLDRLVTEMYARGLSTRDVEDAFRDATGELLDSLRAR